MNLTRGRALAVLASLSSAIEELIARSGSASTHSAISRSVGLSEGRSPFMYGISGGLASAAAGFARRFGLFVAS